MKLKLVNLSVILSLLLFVGGCTNDEKAKESTVEAKESFKLEEDFIEGTVTKIVDGDTILVDLDIEGEMPGRNLYLDGINAPEIEDPIFNKMPFGEESKEHLESLISEGDKLFLDVIGDDYTESVLNVYAYIEDGSRVVQLNYEQVKSGMAYVKENAKSTGEEYSKLKDIEVKAKEGKVGIWSDEDLIVDGLFNEKYLTETGKYYSREELEKGYK